MRDRFFSTHLDFVGFFASVLCAIHCAFLPLLLSFSTLSGLVWLENFWVEFTLISLSFILASWSLGQSYFKHKRKEAIQVVVIGFICILCSRIVDEGYEPLLMVIGGLLIAFSHYLNWNFLHPKVRLEAEELELKREEVLSEY